MISDARGGHVSPGIYTEEKDVTYSVKSLGITSLGLVGETLYGPAFENIEIKDWSEFVDYFGGTSPEKFKGNGYPKYELPYVAKSYLEESKRLNVVRVLGLCGYEAGTAYVVYSDENNEKNVAAVLRSKMVYGAAVENNCENTETPNPVISSIKIGDYKIATYNSQCATVGTQSAEAKKGAFCLIVNTNGMNGYNEIYEYNVSLDPSASDYIYNVIKDDAPIYVEAVYEQERGKTNFGLVAFSSADASYVKYYQLSGVTSSDSAYTAKYVEIESVPAYIKLADIAAIGNSSAETVLVSGATSAFSKYAKTSFTNSIENYYGDFKEMYRPAQTPWIVSEAYATADSASNVNVKMKKLFKVYTISDGNAANYQVKISIANINPVDGTFDVCVRDFNDTDASPLILERFSKCSMVEGDSSYVAYRIGTIDGGYASKSKYIAVEMADDTNIGNAVPCGFLGYPVPKYENDIKINVNYNTTYKRNGKAKKQYFGLNTDVLDSDFLAYKGKSFYDNAGDAEPEAITHGFHLDSILNHCDGEASVDGIEGYVFDAVSTDYVGFNNEPRIINAPAYLKDSLYGDINTRKFTVYCYGGFDGWDVNRDYRSNTDEFNANLYGSKGSFEGVSSENLNLPSTAISSDYYAYLAGYRCFANPQDVDINVFATPGINWSDNRLLTEDVIDIIEDRENRGGDALYVMNSPTGYTADELADLFDTYDFNSSYACTYGPGVMYFDSSSKKYITLPVTKDVVRNMAATDNNKFPWYAPAGIERGNVDCIKAEYKTSLADEDNLYENNINPVKTFAQDGVKIWGNKTAYQKDSPLNRINVRRLMIRVQKLVKEAAKNLIFDQYDDTLEKQFKGLVEPILADVKSNRGIYDYRVITECTAETRDQHILPAKILIKPTPALEYISISFTVYPESIEFSDEI